MNAERAGVVYWSPNACVAKPDCQQQRQQRARAQLGTGKPDAQIGERASTSVRNREADRQEEQREAAANASLTITKLTPRPRLR